MSDEVKPCYVGLDLSMTGSGVSVKVSDEISLYTIKTTPKTCENDLKRLRHICNEVMSKIPKDGVRMICIEDFFTPSNPFQIGAAIGLAMLGATVRLALYEAGFPFVVISPSQLKKYVLGKGVGQKGVIVREVYRKWNITAADDNQADSAGLMFLAESLYMKRSGIEQAGLIQPQKDVIATISKDRPKYNLV